jgi:hypothetical protein
MTHFMGIIEAQFTGWARQSKASRGIDTREQSFADRAIEVQLNHSGRPPKPVHAREERRCSGGFESGQLLPEMPEQQSRQLS